MSPEAESQRESRARPDDAYKMLGRLLRSVRDEAGISPGAAARHISGSASKISRIEGGQVKIKEDDLHELLTLFKVTDTDEWQAMLQFVCRLNNGQWWDPYRDVLDGWFLSYLVMESIARHIRTYELLYVPGLLQTRRYAEAVVGAQHSNKDEIRRRVDMRMQRQRTLLETGAPHLWAVVDQTALDVAALPDGIAGPEVMREQIEFLKEAAKRPNVTIQILPPGVAARAGVGTAFSLLRLRLKRLPAVAYLEYIDDALFLDDPDKADRYEFAMNRLTIAADTPGETVATLTEALNKIPDA